MGVTKFQKTVFTTMMCFFMVLGMTVYNMYLARGGWGEDFLLHLLRDFWLGFAIALFLDIVVVGPLAKKLAHRIHGAKEGVPPIIMILTISCSMVLGMVTFMSLFGSVQVAGLNPGSLAFYPKIFLRNLIMALPLNLLIVGNLVRFLFSRIFAIDVRKDPEETLS